jgi:hypothetical protein
MLQAAHSSQVRHNPVGGILFTPSNAQRDLTAVNSTPRGKNSIVGIQRSVCYHLTYLCHHFTPIYSVSAANFSC